MPRTNQKGEPFEFSLPQTVFLLLDDREGFYGGAAGGGKSAALLMAALQYVDHPGYRALILRRTYAQLTKGDALIPLAHEWLQPTDAVWNEQKKIWTFPSGATLEFGHVQNENDKHDYQGAAYQFVGFDELTQFTVSQYEYIAFSRQRRRTDLDVPIRVRSTSNPGGAGHGWVKRRYITSKKPGVVFVPAKVADNPGLDVEDYRASLMQMSSAELVAQLLDGDWDVHENAAYRIADEHLVDRFTLEDAHNRFEACDYGLNGAPWALWAVDFEGNVIACDMLYERQKLPDDVATLVIAKRKAWWGNDHRAFADPSIWHRTGARDKWGAPKMLADEFTDHGVVLEPGNNDPRAGLIRVRSLLKPDEEHPFPSWHPRAGQLGAPRMFMVRGACDQLIEELRDAPLQPLDKRDGGEIVDPEWESLDGHAAAMARYAAMTRPEPSTEPEKPLDDPRAEFLRQYELERDKPKRSYQFT